MKSQYLSPKEYAELKNVVPGRISQLKSKLKKKEIGHHWYVKICPENDELFNKPSANSKRKNA
jgi:hypothetical protein